MSIKTAGGYTLPPLNEEVKERILTSALLNTRRTSGGHEVWTATKTPAGYGRMSVRYKGEKFTLQAHRAIWAAHNGKWPSRFDDIHHTCGNPSCVNPDHLERRRAAQHTGVVRKSTGWANQYGKR